MSVFSITALDAFKEEGQSGSTTFSFEVVRSGSTAGSASVDFLVPKSLAAGVSATGSDFVGGTLPPGRLKLANAQDTKILNISVAGDSVVEQHG